MKKVLIGLAAVIVFIALAMGFLMYRNRSLSPSGSDSLRVGDFSASITYARPSVRGRLIFGTKDQNALQPYGTYWRLGANESTELTINKNILFNGQALSKGTYRLYALPGEKEFQIGVNKELDTWGALEPNYALDLFRTKVPVIHNDKAVEQYTIEMAPGDKGGIDVIFEWSDVKFIVPLEPQ